MFTDTSNGTEIIGSSFGNLRMAYRNREDDDCCHTAVGRLRYVDDWLLVDIDDGIAEYYAAQISTRFGIQLQTKSKWGTHVSAIRGEPLLQNQDQWGHDDGLPVSVHYTHNIYTNGKHWWLNVRCDDLTVVRGHYGLPTTKWWFHLTIGRL